MGVGVIVSWVIVREEGGKVEEGESTEVVCEGTSGNPGH